MKYEIVRPVLTLVVVGLLAWAGPAARAVERPFRLTEHGTAEFNTDGSISSEGSGEATHLGQFTLVREATLYDPIGSEFEVDGEATLTTANGDLLFASIEGTFDAATGTGVLIYEWQGGTGRFANATGTTVWLVTLHPDLTYDVVAEGVIDF
jgi:hypothetical protein